jgi:endoglucanase
MAKRLSQVHAPGFSLNVSNFRATAEVAQYGAEISRRLGVHFVIDTSRNGRGPIHNEWCNPPGRALGTRPTTTTGNPLIDAYLWIKVPGESDGTCRHGPPAGQWWPQYALGLARRSQALD